MGGLMSIVLKSLAAVAVGVAILLGLVFAGALPLNFIS
jgi:hypothetical protein